MKFDPSKATDAELLARFEQGRDRCAFAELVRRHGEMVRATTRRVLRCREDSDDAFQVTFFALARAAGRLRNKAALAGWLHKTAYRAAREIQNYNVRQQTKVERMKERVVQSQIQTGENDHPSLKVANEELMNILDEEVNRLPEDLQIAIVLCELEGLTQKEASKQLDVAPSTVAERISKARKLLCNRMLRRGVTLSLSGFAACVTASNESSMAMTSALVADTTAKATLFAAGKSAAEIGVATSVIRSANKVISAMTTAKMMAVGLAAISIVVFAGSLGTLVGTVDQTAQAGRIFFDNFSDGSHSDGNPVAWVSAPFTQGAIDAAAGGLTLAPNENSDTVSGVVGVAADGVRVGDTSIQVQVGIGASSDFAYVAVRNQSEDDFLAYVAGVGYSQQLGGSYFAVSRFDGMGQSTLYTPQVGNRNVLNLPFDVRREDAVVQLDVIGDEIRAWVWRAGGRRPNEPQYFEIDDKYSEPGFVALGLSSFPPGALSQESEATFGYVELSNTAIVPEPTAAALGLLPLVVLLGTLLRSVRR